jgi:hypothetical protein
MPYFLVSFSLLIKYVEEPVKRGEKVFVKRAIKQF